MQFPTRGTASIGKSITRKNYYKNMNLTMVEVYSEDLSELRFQEVSLNCVAMQFPTRDAINIKALIM